MKYFIIFMLAIITPVFANDFREMEWGSTPEQVIENEGASPVAKNATELMWKDSIDNKDCEVWYMFVNNKLFRGAYVFTETYSNENKYVDRYKSVNKILIDKYLKPHTNEVRWDSDLYKGDHARRGMAVLVGDAVYGSQWTLKQSTIMHLLSGGNFEANHFIMYNSIQLLPEYQTQQKQKTSSKF
jgi:hypothetical protein